EGAPGAADLIDGRDGRFDEALGVAAGIEGEDDVRLADEREAVNDPGVEVAEHVGGAADEEGPEREVEGQRREERDRGHGQRRAGPGPTRGRRKEGARLETSDVELDVAGGRGAGEGSSDDARCDRASEEPGDDRGRPAPEEELGEGARTIGAVAGDRSFD